MGELEEQFARIEAGERTSDRLNAVFRAVHSIKGGAGAFGFTELVSFSHAYETLLDQIRDRRLDLSNTVISLCIRANDIVADFVKAARTGEHLADGYGMAEKAQFDLLTSGEDSGGDEPMEEFDIDFTPVRVDIGRPVPPPPGDAFAMAPLTVDRNQWEIRFTPHSELYARANDPLLLFR